jgi:hypothetical protein
MINCGSAPVTRPSTFVTGAAQRPPAPRLGEPPGDAPAPTRGRSTVSCTSSRSAAAIAELEVLAALRGVAPSSHEPPRTERVDISRVLRAEPTDRNRALATARRSPRRPSSVHQVDDERRRGQRSRRPSSPPRCSPHPSLPDRARPPVTHRGARGLEDRPGSPRSRQRPVTGSDFRPAGRRRDETREIDRCAARESDRAGGHVGVLPRARWQATVDLDPRLALAETTASEWDRHRTTATECGAA